uniref:Uncharacterized protein n=1 Tax=Mantoniella antarctica TaxID=81844 RepID=A0A7S0SHT1_9CHLO
MAPSVGPALAVLILLLVPLSAVDALAPTGRNSVTLGGDSSFYSPSKVFHSTEQASVSSPDLNGLCKAHTTAAACGKPCKWCSSAAVPSACYAPRAAARLPPGVFECK